MSEIVMSGPVAAPGQIEPWAGRIAAAWQKSLDAVFETGRLIVAAKAEMPHGAFTAMVENDLPFGARYAQMLMKIAEHPQLTNPKHASVLPTSPATLYELAKLEPEVLERRFAEKAIRPDMQRRDVAVNGARSIMAGREQQTGLDFFPTPPWATRTLMEVVLPHLGVVPGDLGAVWEPACGEGHMTGVLAEYLPHVVGSDVKHYCGKEGRSAPGWGVTFDFLAGDAGSLSDLRADWIITNPPFGETTLAFALRALELAGQGVALFVRQQWLEGVERYETLFKDRPPTLYAQFSERVNLCEGRWDPFGSTATAYCWLVWMKDVAPQPPLWIPPGQRKRFFYADDQARFTARPVLPPKVSAREAEQESVSRLFGGTPPKGNAPLSDESASSLSSDGAVTDAEFVEYKALHAIASGVSVSGEGADRLRAAGLVWPDALLLTSAGMERAQELHARVRAAQAETDPYAIRAVRADSYRSALELFRAHHTGELTTDAVAPVLRAGRAAGVSPKQLAADLGCSVGSVKGRLNRLGLTSPARLEETKWRKGGAS